MRYHAPDRIRRFLRVEVGQLKVDTPPLVVGLRRGSEPGLRQSEQVRLHHRLLQSGPDTFAMHSNGCSHWQASEPSTVSNGPVVEHLGLDGTSLATSAQ